LRRLEQRLGGLFLKLRVADGDGQRRRSAGIHFGCIHQAEICVNVCDAADDEAGAVKVVAVKPTDLRIVELS
jgi:hypothetical protein